MPNRFVCSHLLGALVALTSTVLAPAETRAQAPAQQTEIDNVAAFARMYGAARWFYPSDAAASLDWNRFAVYGVSRVRGARTPADLQRTLEELFAPLGPGIAIGTRLPPKQISGLRDASLVAWHHHGPGMNERPNSTTYRSLRMNRAIAVQEQRAATVAISQTFNAELLRGKTVRLSGRMRAATSSETGWGGMWLRVDRNENAVGFLDNMSDRPVRDTAWRQYVIEALVAADATRIAVGALSVGNMLLDVDDVEFAVRGPDGTWTSVALSDASFEGQPGTPWFESNPNAVSRIRSGAPHGEQFARVGVITAPRPVQTAKPSDSLETPISGAHTDFALTRGLSARIPLSLTDAEARSEARGLTELNATLRTVGLATTRNDLDIRYADALVAWNLFRHFYPYWQDLDVDWDSRLRVHLGAAASAAETRDAHHDVVRAVVADLQDGHGNSWDSRSSVIRAMLPVNLRLLGDTVVVTASQTREIPVGSVVTAINGKPTSELVRRELQLVSGTPQWRRVRVATQLQTCQLGSDVTLSISAPDNSNRDTKTVCNRRSNLASGATRPDSITELRPGVWYVDITRVRAAQLTAMAAALAQARAIIVDVRGYPTDAGFALLPHLMRTGEDSTDRWMHVPRYARPFGEITGWNDMTWNLKPATPQFGGERVFLTDGHAISYAESVMGYVRDYKLGTIIGGSTAGANGDIVLFTVPGGFSMYFSGLRVTRHDGKTRFHADGVGADIKHEPTLAGIRAGRDEVLERALALLNIRP